MASIRVSMSKPVEGDSLTGRGNVDSSTQQPMVLKQVHTDHYIVSTISTMTSRGHSLDYGNMSHNTNVRCSAQPCCLSQFVWAVLEASTIN